MGEIGGHGTDVYLGYANRFTSTRGDTVYILDQKNVQVVACKGNGQKLFLIGRQGQGPGEYQRPTDILWSDGILYLSDSGLNRISRFDSDGSYLDSISLQAPPLQLVAIQPHLYAGVRSSRAIAVGIDLRSPEQRREITWDEAGFSDLPMMRRIGQRSMARVGDRVFIGIPSIGVFLQVKDRRVVGSLTPTNEFTKTYWPFIEEHMRELAKKTPGAVGIPSVFWDVTTWKDRFLMVHFHDSLENYPSTIVVIDPDTGQEAGPRIVAESKQFYHLTELPNGLFAWANPDNATVLLYDFSPMLSRYVDGDFQIL